MLRRTFAEQINEPIGFLGSALKKAEKNWTTFAQEAFVIFQTFKKMDYSLQGHRDVGIFTEHRNLLLTFAPLVMEPSLGRHIVTNVQRWALFLSKFGCTIEHIRGEDNVFADI